MCFGDASAFESFLLLYVTPHPYVPMMEQNSFHHYLMNLPYPTIPLFLTPHVGALMYKNPFVSDSKSSFGRAFEGADCFAAGPPVAIPVTGSYVLP